ncbi:hypothetical protein PHSY_002786 [Pseudozyma hubeiensis SY62]|uniref:Uncharacterized protein n=1 Tax=Pseudozyma hubeiensis (strain SY62) TaxID=1305764 RepID=R9P1S9_PSEHS|nr:hypothetical protein PHSY_002786 [Pseudozyma hubeiensis SY62]GAC95211.1 hypothetical protein PHSY_002786 [Pseudozyma hubeiensis SY62]
MEAVHLATATASLAAAAPTSISGQRGWLPLKSQLGMKHRLFSKNILGTGDIWSRGTATWTSSFASAVLIAAVFCFIYLVFFTTGAGQSNTISRLRNISDRAHSESLDKDLDSDEYEDEDDSTRSSGFLVSSKERLALRKMLGRNDHTLSKRSSIVRITSSDPTSSLCEHPMQVDLEPPTRRSFWPAPVSHTSPSESSTPDSPVGTTPALTVAVQRNSSSSPGPSGSRRRKESGRLHTASPSRSPLGPGAALPTRPARVRPVDVRSPLARAAARNKRNSASSVTSSEATHASTGSPRLAATQDSFSSSTLSPHAASDRDQLPDTPSIASESSSISAALGHASAFGDDMSPSPSPTSSTFSLGRAPSILKRQPQTFRTASLREIDISHSLVERRESLPILVSPGPGADPALLQQQQQEFLQAYGVLAPPSYQPSDMQIRSSRADPETPWSPHTKVRSIKLVEPDWLPHTDTHVRARERLEAATRFAAFKANAQALTPTLVSPDAKYDQQQEDLAGFRFERFTQSTAAAGRDWDWRKRRARLQRAAALGMALGQSNLGSPLGANPPGNVGMTDVQLQQQAQSGGAPLPAVQAASSVRKQMPAAPLITFTEQELKTAPVLKVDTESGRRPMLRPGGQSPLRPSANQADGTPSSPTPSGAGTPMGGIFGAATPSADSINVVMAARVAQRRRASEDAGSYQDARRGIVSKLTRRKLSASASDALPSSPGPSSRDASPVTTPGGESFASSALRDQSISPLRSTGDLDLNGSYESESESNTASPSHSVPGRLSSLSGTVGKNLRSGLRRSSDFGASGKNFTSTSSGIELVPDSPDLDADGSVGGSATYPDPGPSQEGPRSSADAYSHSVPSGEVQIEPSMRRAASASRNDDPRSSAKHVAKAELGRKSQPPSFRGGSSFARQASAPVASTYHHDHIEELRQDSERDSISRGSNDSDSLRRRMRARSQTESATIDASSVLMTRNSSITARQDGLAALTAGMPTSSPPAVKSRARNGSRSSIMRSASGASSDLNRTAKRRSSIRHGSSLASDTSSIGSSSMTNSGTGSRNGSLRHGSSPVRSRRDSSAGAPDPLMQPEPAPRGMAQRARSASLSSNASSLASANSSRTASRSNSFRDGGGSAGRFGLSMTSSNPGTPGSEGERRSDPFSMTALSSA